MLAKTSKKVLSLLLTLAMLCGLLVTTALATNGTWAGAGTEASPYEIADQADLEAIRTGLSATNSYSGVYFKLTNDITLTGNWTPIGGNGTSTSFAGTFDGDGHTISNLNIIANSNDHIGLFGDVAAGGTVKNLTVSSGRVDGGVSVDGVVSGGKNTGAIVGRNYGTVENCRNTGCAVYSYGIGQGVGGVVGSCWNNGTIKNCSNSAAVTGQSATTYTGGVVGKAESDVINCTNSGAVSGVNYVGGVVGYTVEYPDDDCSNTGTVSCTTTGGETGSIYGYCVAAPGASGAVSITGEESRTITGNSVITISTPEAVTLVGNGTAYAVTIKYDPGVDADLTLDNVLISAPSSSTTNVIDFADGTTNNTLTIKGTNLLENENTGLNPAVIHVPATTALTFEGDGNLYLYKSSMGAGIGSDVNEASGEITFNHTGAIFAKGTKTGATIGGDTGVGDIIINSGILNVETNARGAGIGGSNQCSGGDVYLNGGNVYIVCDFTGHAIGSGAASTNGGNLYITGGSLQTKITSNAATSGLTQAINADIYGETDSDSVSATTINLANTAFEFEPFTVQVGNNDAWSCAVNHWDYTASTASTIANWTYYGDDDETGFNSTVTFYLPSSVSTVTLTALHDDAEVGTAVLNVSTGAITSSTIAAGASVVYLNTGASSNGNGSAGQPYNTLSSAVSSGKTVILLDAVDVASDTTLAASVESVDGYTGRLFNVAAGKVLTLNSGASITGNGVGADIYLADGAKITLGATLTGNLTVESAVTTSGTVIATCTSTTIATESATKITVNGVTARAFLNNIVI